MRPAREITRLEEAAVRRCDRLIGFANTCSLPINTGTDRNVAYITIETLNLWGSFTRAYYLSCVIGARDKSGVRIAVNSRIAPNPAGALVYAIHKYRPSLRKSVGPFQRRDEPAWHDLAVFHTLVREIGSSTLHHVDAALSYSPLVFRHLVVCRNFFAHRNQDTASKVRSITRMYLVSPTLRPSEFLLNSQPRRPQPILLDWLDGVRDTISIVCAR